MAVGACVYLVLSLLLLHKKFIFCQVNPFTLPQNQLQGGEENQNPLAQAGAGGLFNQQPNPFGGRSQFGINPFSEPPEEANGGPMSFPGAGTTGIFNQPSSPYGGRSLFGVNPFSEPPEGANGGLMNFPGAGTGGIFNQLSGPMAGTEGFMNFPGANPWMPSQFTQPGMGQNQNMPSQFTQPGMGQNQNTQLFSSMMRSIPNATTLTMFKVFNPTFGAAEGNMMLNNLFCMRCLGESNFFCMSLYCMATDA